MQAIEAYDQAEPFLQKERIGRRQVGANGFEVRAPRFDERERLLRDIDDREARRTPLTLKPALEQLRPEPRSRPYVGNLRPYFVPEQLAMGVEEGRQSIRLAPVFQFVQRLGQPRMTNGLEGAGVSLMQGAPIGGIVVGHSRLLSVKAFAPTLRS